MKFTALLLGLCMSSVLSYCVDNTTIAYTASGAPSIIGTFYNCLETVQDGLIASFYDNNIAMNVSTEMWLNNLINVDEASSTVTLDILFIMVWVCIPLTLEL